MKHTCTTGVHKTPSRNCYRGHGCRCDGCRADKRDQSAGVGMPKGHPGLSRATVEVPRRDWERIVRQLHRRGFTVDEWLSSTADLLERKVG